MALLYTANLTLAKLVASQAEAENAYNEAVQALDGLVFLAVIDRDLTAPPGGESNGDVYLVADGATDGWSGKDGKVALYNDGYVFFTVNEGFAMWVIDENVYLVWDGSVWKSIMVETGRDDYAKAPAAAATEVLAGQNAGYDGGVDLNPEYPSNLRFVLTGSGGSTDVDVVITGILADGSASTESINVTGANGNTDGDKAWATISNITIQPGGGADFDGGTITTVNGTKLGLRDKNVASIYKETFNGADEGVLGTYNNTFKTYIPSGALNGAAPLELWYKTAQFV